MLSVIGGPAIQHVIRTPDIYLVPRTGGRLLIGATLEEAGYDKHIDPAIIQRLRDAAIRVAPAIAEARILKAWTGLRPGTPDNLPFLGPTDIPGYFAATGHYRDGILLAPVTAHVMSQLILGENPDHDLSPFSPSRLEKTLSS
jgi:glycine oxidase